MLSKSSFLIQAAVNLMSPVCGFSYSQREAAEFYVFIHLTTTSAADLQCTFPHCVVPICQASGYIYMLICCVIGSRIKENSCFNQIITHRHKKQTEKYTNRSHVLSDLKQTNDTECTKRFHGNSHLGFILLLCTVFGNLPCLAKPLLLDGRGALPTET